MRLVGHVEALFGTSITVAMGTVSAARLPPPIAPNVARYTSIGVTMPPTAAMHGSRALRTDERL